MHAVIILETIGPKEALSNYFLGKCFFCENASLHDLFCSYIGKSAFSV